MSNQHSELVSTVRSALTLQVYGQATQEEGRVAFERLVEQYEFQTQVATEALAEEQRLEEELREAQRDWTAMYNAKEDERARANGLLEQLQAMRQALAQAPCVLHCNEVGKCAEFGFTCSRCAALLGTSVVSASSPASEPN